MGWKDAPPVEKAPKWASAPAAKAPPLALGDGQGLLRQFAQGASFGFDDELAGAVSAATGGDYASARDAYRRERDQYADANPGKSFVANMAGGLATGIGGGGVLAATRPGQAAISAYRAATPAARFAANVGTGAIGGAVAGLGNADEGSRLAGLGTGAVVGGATGALVQPVAAVSKKIVDTLAPPVRWASDRLRMGPEQQFARKLAEQAERDGMSPLDVARRLRELGPDSMLADVGDNVRGMAEGYALLPGQAKRAANQAIMDRAKKNSGRVVDSLMDSLSVDDINFDAQRLAIHESMREVGKGYSQVFDAADVPIDGNLAKLMQGPTMKSALASAKRIAADDVALGEADEVLVRQLVGFDSVPAKTDAVGMLAEGPQSIPRYESKPTLRVWDYVKRGLDSIINDGTDPITGKLTSQARQAGEMKRKLLTTIDAAVPDYKKVRSQYADQYSLETALKLGRAFASKDSEVTARFLAEMSEPEKAMFRAGAARALRDKVMSAPETGDAYKRIFNSPLMQERLKAVFPDEAAFNKFAKDMQREAAFSQTKAQILGNSRTAAREALRDDAGIDPGVIMDMATGNGNSLLTRMLGRGIQNAQEIPEATRNVAAQYLFATDRAQKAQALRLLREQSGILTNRRAIAPPSLYTPAVSGFLGAQFGGAMAQ